MNNGPLDDLRTKESWQEIFPSDKRRGPPALRRTSSERPDCSKSDDDWPSPRRIVRVENVATNILWPRRKTAELTGRSGTSDRHTPWLLCLFAIVYIYIDFPALFSCLVHNDNYCRRRHRISAAINSFIQNKNIIYIYLFIYYLNF